MKLLATLAVCSMAALGASRPSAAMADPAYKLDIPPQDLGSALKSFGAAVNEQVLFSRDVVAGLRSTEVKGEFTPKAAILLLLKGSGLEADRTSSGVLLIRRPPNARALSSQKNEDPGSADMNSADKEGKKSSSDTFRVAQVDQGPSSRPGSVNGASVSAEPVRLEEVVVTAQKRTERLQDVPIPVSVLDANVLAEKGQLQMSEYYSQFPGLTFTTNGGNWNVLTIRGLTTGGTFTNGTVGAVLDDVPITGSTLNTGGWNIPDIDPSDLAQVEVLRGPQGTLYGANSLGGLVKYVTADPQFDSGLGRVQAGTSTVAHGDKVGYYASGSVNAPVSDTVALRVSGFSREDPGYISNIQTGQKDLNDTEVRGGRAALLWRPADNVNLKLSGLVEHVDKGGSDFVDVGPGLGPYDNTRTRNTGTFTQDLTALSADLTVTLGKFNLKSITGYVSNKSQSPFDQPNFNAISNLYGFSNSFNLTTFDPTKYTQEFRVTASPSSLWDLLVGAFYTHEHETEQDQLFGTSNAVPTPSFNYAILNYPSTYEEYALFEDVTFHMGSNFDIQLGGRQAHYKLTTSSIEVLDAKFADLIGSPLVTLTPATSASSTPLTYMVSPRYRISNAFMVYARFDSGYRPGGSNPSQLEGAGIPASFKQDTTHNYELGLKGEFLDRRVSVDASVYYIDWSDVQIASRTAVGGFAYTSNGGSAKSQGVELSVSYLPTTTTKIGAWIAVNDAELTKTLGPTSTIYGQSGDRLPYSSPFSAHADISQDFPLGRYTGFVAAAFDYVGKRDDVFSPKDPVTGLPESPRANFPSYGKLDLRSGIKMGRYTGTLYANNVTDKRGILAGGNQVGLPEVDYITPRTIGVNIVGAFY